MARSPGVGVAVLVLGVLCGCSQDDPPPPAAAPVVTTAPSSAQPTPSTSFSPSPSPSPSPDEPTPDEDEHEELEGIDEDDLEKALLDADDLGVGWTSAGSTTDGDTEGVWPCDSEPGPSADAQAGKILGHRDNPPIQANLTLQVFADAEDATDYLDEIRENVQDCEDEPVEIPGGNDAEAYFSEYDDLMHVKDGEADAEVLGISLRLTVGGRPAAEGVGVTFRLDDLVGSVYVLAPARHDQTMDDIARSIAGEQIDQAIRRLGRGT